MEGKEWAKWKVKTEKMQSYEWLSGSLFFLTAISLPFTFLLLSDLIGKVLRYGVHTPDVPGAGDLALGALIATSITVLSLFGGLHCYEKAKEIEKEIECEEE